MPGYQRKLGLGEFSIDNVKVSPAHRASMDFNQQLSRAGLWHRQFHLPQWLTYLFEEHGTHGSVYVFRNCDWKSHQSGLCRRSTECMPLAVL
jgi:hypothetical protein